MPVLVRREQLEQVDEVGGEQLRRLRRQPPGQVGVADDPHAVVADDHLVGDRELAVAAVRGSHVDDDAAGLHRGDHLRRDEARRGTAGDQRGGDDDVDVGGLRRIQLGGLAVEVLGRLPGVAVGAGLRLLLGPLDPQELGAHRLDLLAGLGAGVESAHHGAEAAGGTDGSESRDPGADHEDLRRWDLARGGDLTGEEAAELVGRLDDRAVPGDVGHRAEHVERLRAGDARHGVHGQDGDPSGRELGDEVGVDGRADQAGQDRAVTKAGDLLVGRGVDLQHEVAGPHLVLGGDPRAGLLVGGVGEAGPGAGPGLHDDLVTQAPQLLDGLRRGRDPRLPRPGLRRDTENGHHITSASAVLAFRDLELHSGGVEC